jgi:hypothetical protein
MNAQELYKSGVQHFQQNQFNLGLQDLLEASKQKYLPAIKELGLCFLYGIGVKSSLNKAIKYFKIAKADPEAQFELAKLYYFGYGLDKNKKQAKKLLISSAIQNHMPAINLLAICYEINGQSKKAQALFSTLYLQKDRFAIHLANNNYINIKQKSIHFINKFKWPKLQNKYHKNKLNKQPKIFTVVDLLSDIECEYIKYIASPYMRESMTIDPQTGQTIRDHIRTSYSATIDWNCEDPAINIIMEKCCNLFKEKASHSEILHVLHYSVGEEYKPHYDFFGGIESKDNFDESTQRTKTICLYLNDVQSGGETNFPKLELQVTPQKGSAVFFENVNPKSKIPYIESLHAGQPVLKGEKWLATLWIRNQNTQRGPNYDSVPT